MKYKPRTKVLKFNINTSFNTHRLTALFPGLPTWAGTRKIRPIWILLKQETVSGSGISWTICKNASRSRQITTPAPPTQFFTGRIPFLPPNEQHESTEGLPQNIITQDRNLCNRNCKLNRPTLPWNTRSSAIAKGPRDASCQLKSCQLPHNSAETTCTTSPVKFYRGSPDLTTPLSGNIFHQQGGTCYGKSVYQIWSRDVKREPENR